MSTNMPLPLSTMSTATSRKILLLPLFPSPLRRRRREHIQALRGPHAPLVLRHLPPLLPLLLLFLLLPPEVLAQEEGESGGVNVVAASQRRHHQERPHLRLGHLHKRLRPSTCGNRSVSVDTTARLQTFRVAERLGVRLPASPGTRRPSGRSPKNAAFLQQNAHHEPTGGQRELTSGSGVHQHVGNMRNSSKCHR